MTAPTGLGQYVPPAASQGDRVQAQQMVDRPLLVWVRKTQFLNKTKFSATGGDAVYIDFVDLLTNQVYIEVMWMAGAIVDGLKQYAGDGNAYPVKVVKVQGGQHGSYNRIESLGDDPQWMPHIQAHLATFQQLVAQTRAQKEQEWATAMQQAQQPPAPPQAPGMPAAPLTAAGAAANPQAGLYDQAMAMQPPHVQQALMQQAPPAAAAPPSYQPQQYQAPGQPAAPPAQQQQFQQPQAAVAPPQYQQAPAQPPGPPAAAAPPQQFQQAGPPAPAQYGAPPAAPQGLPQQPGAVTGQSVAELQQALNAIG